MSALFQSLARMSFCACAICSCSCVSGVCDPLSSWRIKAFFPCRYSASAGVGLLHQQGSRIPNRQHLHLNRAAAATSLRFSCSYPQARLFTFWTNPSSSSMHWFLTRRADSRLATRLRITRLCSGVFSAEMSWSMTGRPTYVSFPVIKQDA